jgi:acyl-coenzyme A thioesterase PaaI-like protein
MPVAMQDKTMPQNQSLQSRDAPPEGFEVFGDPGGFVHRNGPLYIDRQSPMPTVRLRLGPQHTNSIGIASGGLLMTVLDITLGTNVSKAVGYSGICPTVQFGVNLISGAKNGDELVGSAEVTQVMRSLVFATGRLTVGDKVIATATGVFKIPTSAKQPAPSGPSQRLA